MDIKIEDLVHAIQTAGNVSEDSELIKKINSDQGYIVNTIAGIVQDIKKVPTLEGIEEAIASKVTDIEYCLNDLNFPDGDELSSNIESAVESATINFEMDDSELREIRGEIASIDDKMEEVQTSLLEVEEISNKMEQLAVDTATLTEAVSNLTELIGHLVPKPSLTLNDVVCSVTDEIKVLDLNDSTIEIG